MKKIILSAAIIAACISLTGCGVMGVPATTGSTTTGTTTTTTGTSTVTADAASSILNSLLGGILASTINEQSFVGTWTYQTPEVRFESENLLAQAGGTIVANSVKTKLESYLAKIGIKEGATTFTFKEDKTYTISTKKQVISTGTYSYDKSNKILSMQGALGLMNQSCTVGMDGTNLCLLYDADKLLSLMNAAGSILGKSNSTIGNITTILGQNYNGMKVGFSLSK